VVATHSWESDNPGAGAGMTIIYGLRGLFVTSTDFGFDGSYEGFSDAAEAAGLPKRQTSPQSSSFGSDQ
jgi:hypothetical protein